MEEMPDSAPQFCPLGVGDSQQRFAQVPVHRDDALSVCGEALLQGFQLAFGPLAQQHVDRALALQEFLHEKLADESGGACDEVIHVLFPANYFSDRYPTVSRRWPAGLVLAQSPS